MRRDTHLTPVALGVVGERPRDLGANLLGRRNPPFGDAKDERQAPALVQRALGAIEPAQVGDASGDHPRRRGIDARPGEHREQFHGSPLQDLRLVSLRHGDVGERAGGDAARAFRIRPRRKPAEDS